MAQPVDYLGYMRNLDLTPQFQALGGAIQDRRSRIMAAEAKKQFGADLRAALGNPNQSAFIELMAKYPEQQGAIAKAAELSGAERTKSEFELGAQISMALENGQPEIAQELLRETVEARANSGEKAGIFEQVAAMLEGGNVKGAQATTNLALSMVDPARYKTMVENRMRLAEERRKAREFPQLMRKREAEISRAESDAEVAEIEAKYAEQVQKAELAAKIADAEVERGIKVQSSEILPDGTVVMVGTKGQTVVKDAAGNELVGPARAEAIRAAEEFGADIQARRAGARKGGEIGQVEAQKAFESVGKVQTNLSNIDAAIGALDRGATTGVIASKFPSWKASTIELNNIRSNLGLDVINAVTFGALSEGELNLALDTALPIGMKEADLRQWLVDKKAAQQKLAKYLYDQATFLSVPGRTIGQWLEQSYTPEGERVETPRTESSVVADERGFIVTAPNGRQYQFPTPEAAAQFQAALGGR